MYHSRTRPIGQHEAPLIHSQRCGCYDCALAHPSVGFARRRRIVRAQAFVLGAALTGFYLLVASSAPAIAAAFGWGF